MKRIHNRLAILLIFALLLSLAAPVGAAGSRITIRTPEDLVELSPLFFRQLVPGENSRFICGP